MTDEGAVRPLACAEVIDAYPLAMALFDREGHYLDVNEAACAIIGRCRAELLGRRRWDVLPETRGQSWQEAFRRVAATGRAESVETHDEASDRSYRSTLVRTDAGVLATLEDTTDIEVAAQVEAREAIAESKAAADAANRAKDQFLAMLGHELRNPLAPIRTAVELMRLRPGGPHGRSLDIIERQTHHLMRLVDDLLDVSRIARGELPLQRTMLNVGELIAQSVEATLPLIESREHDLELCVAHDLVVEGDRDRLVQVFSNLLTNAARYTPSGGHIRVEARRQEDQIQVRVIDDGQGIEPALLPHVFDAFVQSEQDRARSTGGMGLGLAIVRSLVERHGGRVVARSAGRDRGSELVVRLPVSPRARAKSGGNGAVSRPRAATTDNPPVREVLLVDDNEDATELLGHCLSALGITVHAARDATEALRIAADTVPDLAILDIGLPDVDGHELAQRLRGLPGWDAVRLVALTGYASTQDRARSEAAGFEHHLVKPVDFAHLVETISAPS